MEPQITQSDAGEHWVHLLTKRFISGALTGDKGAAAAVCMLRVIDGPIYLSK
jgi:hypothetical protein